MGNIRDVIGTSLLHVAARTDDWANAEILITKGAQINAKNASGVSPLHSSMAAGKAKFSENLIKRGADVNMTSLSESVLDKKNAR